MKRIIPFIFLLSISVMACESFNNKLNIQIHNVFNIDISFVSGTEDTTDWVEFHFDSTGSHFMDPSLNKYRDNILDIELDDVKIQISELNKDVELEDLQIRIVSDSYECTWEYSEQFWSKDYTLSLEDDAGQWEFLSLILNAHEDLSFFLEGIVKKKELDFTVSLIIETIIQAED